MIEFRNVAVTMCHRSCRIDIAQNAIKLKLKTSSGLQNRQYFHRPNNVANPLVTNNVTN